MSGMLGDDPWAGRDGARRARYREYLDFYEGNQWQGRPLPGERRLTINYARALVRKCVSYLFPEPVTFAVSPDGPDATARERARRAEEALARVYAENDLAAVDFDAAVDAAVLGDGAFKVVWDEAARRPAVTAVDVQGLSAWWEADDPRRLVRVVQRTIVSGEVRTTNYEVRTDGIGATANQRVKSGPVAGGGPVVMIEDWTAERFTLTVGGEVVRDGANPFGC